MVKTTYPPNPFLGFSGPTESIGDKAQQVHRSPYYLRSEGAPYVSVYLCRRHGVGKATVYGWKTKNGGKDASEAKLLTGFEDENTRLSLLLADAMLASGKQRAIAHLVGRSTG